MKKYIRSSTELPSGSYLLKKDGELISVELHVPSTTFVGRGILHLVPTDAEFLYSEGLITQDDVRCVLDFCFAEYLINIQNKDTSYVPSMMDIVSFTSYAELKYAPTSYTMIMKYIDRFHMDVSEEATSKFYKLSNRWYRYLTDNFVKVAVMNNSVEFRICSEDSFDWNSVIIDDCILEYDLSSNSSTRYSILRESSKGYKAYFLNATIDDILEEDDTVLSSTLLDRRVSRGQLLYVRK